MSNFTLTMMNPNEIRTHETFKTLFPIKPELLARIEADMKERHFRYDPSQPVVVASWEGQNELVCIDGHTRIKAAINAGIDKIPVMTHEFDTENEAFEYAIHLQCHRRNLTDGDLLHLVVALDKRKKAGRPKKELAQSCANFPASDPGEDSCAAGKSAQALADALGISLRKAEQIRTLIKHADPEILAAVYDETMSINKAYTGTQEKRKAEKTAADGEEPQPVPMPEDATEEADPCEEEEESSRDECAEHADDPDVDEKTDEDTSDEAVECDKPNQGPYDDAPEDEVDEGPGDDGDIEDEAEAEPMSNEGVNDRVTDTTVTLSPEQYQALESLGGSVEEHVAQAIEAYLSSTGQADAYDPKEEKLAKIAADIARDLAAKYDEEPEEDDYDDGEYEDQGLAWAEPVLTASAAA
jgi:ParB-like chromosome segregation protein Spo0J